MPTFDELTQEVISHQFSPVQYKSYIQARLNQGQDYVTAQTDFRELMVTVAMPTTSGEPGYDLPDDFQRLVNVTIQTPNPTAFDASRTQIAAGLARAVRSGMRGM